MATLALTGGIASGKSFVADELAKLGAVIIDSDVLAREVVRRGTPGLEMVRERFGSGVLRPDGTLDRGKMGELIFSDEVARQDLNAIVHPLVRARARELEGAAPAGAVVIHVVPLLVETGLHERFDGVIVVDVPTETQVHRLMRRNDFDLESARLRVRAQAVRQDRLDVADWVVDNSGDEATTVQQVQDLWPRLVQFAAGEPVYSADDAPHGGQEHMRLRSP